MNNERNDIINNITATSAENNEGAQTPSPAVPNTRGSNWAVAEDEQVCRSWIHISLDAVAGADQRLSTLWARIHANYMVNKTTSGNRSVSSIQSRWGNIKRDTSKFCRFLQQIKNRNQIGINEYDQVCQIFSFIFQV